MLANADMSSSLGIASDTRGANLDVTGPSDGPSPRGGGFGGRSVPHDHDHDGRRFFVFHHRDVCGWATKRRQAQAQEDRRDFA
jgi:hypothetical protein